MVASPFAVGVSGNRGQTFYETWNTGSQTSPGASWSSSKTSIATVNSSGIVAGVAVGSISLQAVDFYFENIAGEYCTTNTFSCPTEDWGASAPGTVFDVGAAGPGYIFVGTDTHEISANEYQVTNGAHTALPQPTGGTCCMASSDTSDSITQTPNGNNPFTFHIQTLDQSAASGDRRLTFEYNLSNGEGTSVQLNVTARKFAFLTNSSPGNSCKLAYGTARTYVYTVYTHPDKQAVVSSDGLEGTVVEETFNPALTCATITGNGGIQPGGEINDNISSGCSSAPLTCTQTSTQSISVAG